MLDKLIAAAAAEVDEAMLRGLPESEECHVEFSAWFEKKMKRVQRRGRHPAVYRVMQRAAVFVLVLFLGFAAVMAVSPTVRASVFGWIRETYESYNRYYFEDRPAADVRNADYYISGLDSDYEVYCDNGDNGGRFIVYQNSDGEFVQFVYNTDYADSSFNVKQEGCLVEEVSINGNSGDMYIFESDSESNCIVWGEPETGVMFYISGYFDAEELIALAESVCRKSEEQETVEIVEFVLTGLSEEYTKVLDFEENGNRIVSWTDGDGQTLHFSYGPGDVGNFYVEKDGYDVSTVTFAGKEADLYLARDDAHSNGIIWFDDASEMAFFISGYLEQEELIALAQSVRRADGYVLTGLPEGYEMIGVNDSPGYYTAVYANKAEDLGIFFSYGFTEDGGCFILIPDECDMVSAKVGGKDADLYLTRVTGRNNSIIWSDDQTRWIFYLSAPMDRDALIALAESVEPVG